MASIEAAIEARALAFAGLSVIGTSPRRFAPVEGRQGWPPPYVVYSVISDPPHHVMGADKESRARVQVDVFGANWAECRTVKDQVLLAFDRWAGLSGGTTVLASVCENRGQTIQPDEPSLMPRLTLEFLVDYLL